MSGTSRESSSVLSGTAGIVEGAREAEGALSGTASTAASKQVSGSYGGMYIPDMPVLVISDLAFTITRNAITISFAVSADATCRVTYATAIEVDEMLLLFKYFSPNHVTHAHQITGLVEGTVYWIQVRAFDASGNNAFSPAVSTWHAVQTATISDPGGYLGIVS
jgi:hypothetical protein